MSQQTKVALEFIIKAAAVVTLGIIGFFAREFAVRAEETRDSMIRLEVQFGDHKEYSNNNDAYIKLKLMQLEQDVRQLSK